MRRTKWKPAWYDDEDLYEQEASPIKGYGWNKQSGTTGYHGYTGYTGYAGYNYTYQPYTWKPKYNMSFSLEKRVGQLSSSLTGKIRKLRQAEFWHVDENFIYYNPSDLSADSTDDEVLGRILFWIGNSCYPEHKIDHQHLPEKGKLFEYMDFLSKQVKLSMTYTGVFPLLQEFWKSDKTAMSSLDSKSDIVEQSVSSTILKSYSRTVYGHRVSSDLAKNIAFIDSMMRAGILEETNTISELVQDIFWNNNKARVPELVALCPDLSEESMKELELLAQELESTVVSATKEAERDKQDAERAGRKLSKAGNEDRNEEPDSCAEWNDLRNKYRKEIALLTKELGSVLKQNAREKYLDNLRRGKLDGRKLHKLATGLSPKIFHKKLQRKESRQHVICLFDRSGSMYGSGVEATQGLAVILAETFSKIGLPYSFIAYDHQVFVLKGRNSGLRRAEILIGLEADGGTDDTKPLEVVLEYQKKTREESLIILVTDGESYGSATALVADIRENNGAVTALGFGSGCSDKALKDRYGSGEHFQSFDQLVPRTIQLIKSQIKRT